MCRELFKLEVSDSFLTRLVQEQFAWFTAKYLVDREYRNQRIIFHTEFVVAFSKGFACCT